MYVYSRIIFCSKLLVQFPCFFTNEGSIQGDVFLPAVSDPQYQDIESFWLILFLTVVIFLSLSQKLAATMLLIAASFIYTIDAIMVHHRGIAFL